MKARVAVRIENGGKVALPPTILHLVSTLPSTSVGIEAEVAPVPSSSVAVMIPLAAIRRNPCSTIIKKVVPLT
jgi:hypothetical protein